MKIITALVMLFGFTNMAKADQNCFRIEDNEFGYEQLCLQYSGEPTNAATSISVLRHGTVVDVIHTYGEPSQQSKHCSKDGDCWVDPRGVRVFAEDADFEISLYLLAPSFVPVRTAYGSSSISLKKEGVRFLHVN